MNNLKELKSRAAYLGLALAGFTLHSRTASAEVPLVEKDGWTFSFDGRVNAFLSTGWGQDLPVPTADPSGGSHVVMGGPGSGTQSGNGVLDVGFATNYQNDENNKFFATRVRSGMFGNILGFALTKKFSDTSNIRGYVSIWSTVETLGRDKWAPVTAEAREGFFTATGTWGSATVGRMMGLLGRTGYEIDVLYGHGYGVGMPCTDALGPACGHIGTGVLFPGYSAGAYYTTPSLGGLHITAGVFDPIVFNSSDPKDWSRASIVRVEGAATFDASLGDTGKLKIGAEGLFQPLARVQTTSVMDPVSGATTTTKSNITTSVWGASGGARVEIGPVRIGASGFRGKGIGLGYAAARSSATEDNSTLNPTAATYELRTFTGYYAQAGLVFGDLHLGAGYGQGIIDQLDADKVNPKISVLHTQSGISGTVYYHVSDNVVLDLDYFHFSASWYGAPVVDMTGAAIGKLAGEEQAVDFVNAGVTYRW